jgi:hypothetical protein
MAESSNTVASIGPLLELSGTILATGYEFLSRVSKVPSGIRGLLTEVARMNCSLGHLDNLLDASAAPIEILQFLKPPDILNGCHELLSVVNQMIEACESVDRKDIGLDGRPLVWPLKEKETGDVLKELAQLRRYLTIAVNEVPT